MDANPAAAAVAAAADHRERSAKALGGEKERRWQKHTRSTALLFRFSVAPAISATASQPLQLSTHPQDVIPQIHLARTFQAQK
jgi:hypothetical protein